MQSSCEQGANRRCSLGMIVGNGLSCAAMTERSDRVIDVTIARSPLKMGSDRPSLSPLPS